MTNRSESTHWRLVGTTLAVAVTLGGLIAGCSPSSSVFSLSNRAAKERISNLLERKQLSPARATELGWAVWLYESDVVAARDWFRRGRDAGLLAQFGAAEAAYWGPWADEAAERWAELLHAAEPRLQRLAIARLAGLLDRTPRAAELALKSVGSMADASPGVRFDREVAQRVWARRVGVSLPEATTAIREWKVAGPLDPGEIEVDASLAGLMRATGELSGQPWRAVRAPSGEIRPHPLQAGYFVARAEWSAPRPGKVAVRIRGEASIRLLVDGREVLSRDEWREYPPRVLDTTLELDAGAHAIVLIVRTTGAHQSFAAHLTSVERRPRVPTEALPWMLSTWVDANLDWERGDTQSALKRLQGLGMNVGPWPPLLALNAFARAADPTLDPARAAERRAAALRDAQFSDPALIPAVVETVLAYLDQGELEAAVVVLEQAEATVQRRGGQSAALFALRGRVEIAQGHGTDGRAALSQALAIHPGLCSALSELTQLSWGKPALLEILRARRTALLGCPSTQRWVLESDIRSGRHEEALTALRALRAERPDDSALFRAELDVYRAAGRPDALLETLEARVARFPSDVSTRWALVDAAARYRRDKAVSRHSASLAQDAAGRGDVRRKLAMRGIGDAWRDLAFDGLALASDTTPRPAESGASLVYLLDDRIDVLFADGARAVREHLLVRVQTESAVEDIGEVSIANGAEIVLIRTIKPDGRVVYPEDIDQKESLSLTELEVGDAVELATLQFESADVRFGSGHPARAFGFASVSGPIRKGRLVILSPEGSPVRARLRGRPWAGTVVEPIAETLPAAEGFAAQAWQVEGVPQFTPEPLALNPMAFVPHVEYANASWDEYRQWLWQSTRAGLRLPPGLVRDADRVARRAGGERERARALYRLVRDSVEPDPDASLSESAERTWAAGRGDRTVLYAGLLERAAIPYRIHLALAADRARPWEEPEVGPGWYAAPVVEVSAGEGPSQWVDLQRGNYPYDYLPPELQDRPCLSLGSGSPAARTGNYAVDRDAHSIEAFAEMGADRVLHGRVDERIEGHRASLFRAYFDASTEEEARLALEERLAASFPGAVVSDVDIRLESAADESLEVAYDFTARLGSPGGASLDFALFPVLWGQTYAAAGTRTTPVLVAQHGVETVDLEIALLDGVEADSGPPPAEIESPWVRFGRTVDREDGGKLIRVRRRLESRIHVVDADDYGAFQGLAARLDGANRIRLPLTTK